MRENRLREAWARALGPHERSRRQPAALKGHRQLRLLRNPPFEEQAMQVRPYCALRHIETLSSLPIGEPVAAP
jgi:hypothetical protein